MQNLLSAAVVIGTLRVKHLDIDYFFYLIPYIPVNNFSVVSGLVYLG